MAAPDDRGRATIYDDRVDRKGTASLWRYGHNLVRPGEPLEGQVRWDTPKGYEKAVRSEARARSEERYHATTQVLITDDAEGGYAVSVNGELVTPDADGVVYLQSFQGPFRVDSTGKSLVGPVSLGLVAKTGTHAPSTATVSIVQKTVVSGQSLPDTVVDITDLPCGDEQAVLLPALTIPYPARFTESPYIEIQSVELLREKQTKAFRTKAIALSIGLVVFLVYGLSGGMVAVTAFLNAMYGAENMTTLFNAFSVTFGAKQLSALLQVLAPVLNLFGVGRNFAPLMTAAKAVNRLTDPKTAPTDESEQKATLAVSASEALKEVNINDVSVKKYRKYTIRALTQTLNNLMKVESQKQYGSLQESSSTKSGIVENKSINVKYASSRRNDKVILDYLLHDDGWINKGLNIVSDFLQRAPTGFGLSGNSLDAQGKAQTGLLFATPGDALVRGLDWDVLQSNYTTTSIVVEIVDGARVWKVRIKADAQVGFAAGYHASGLVGDLRAFEATLKRFAIVHPETTKVPKDRAIEASVAAESGIQLRNWFRLFNYASTWKAASLTGGEIERWNLLVDAMNSRLNLGADKLRRQMAPRLQYFRQGPKTTRYATLMARGDQLYDYLAVLELQAGLGDALHRFRPQRIKATPVMYTFTELNALGVSGTDDNTEEVRDTLPITAAFDETRHARHNYALSWKHLWTRLESATHTRMLWYDLFVLVNEAGVDEGGFQNAVVNVAGSTGVAFCADGQLLPLNVRDRLQWWSEGNRDPTLTAAVRLVATKPPTPVRDTPETTQRRAIARSTPPDNVAELLAAHAVADALIARVIMRSQLSEGMRMSTTAIDAVRSVASRVVEVLRACSVGDDNAAHGMLSENDPMFACLLGGADAARVLHCLGAWTRRAEVSMAVDAPRIIVQRDETLEQRTALYNSWPVEAKAQLKAVIGVLQRTTTLSLASMPIYALQNAISDLPGCSSDEVDARLSEALASVARTRVLGKALGLTYGSFNPVLLRLVVHWPVVLAAALAAKTEGAFGERLAVLEVRVPALGRSIKRVSDDESMVDAELFRMRNASLRVDPETFEAFDEANYLNGGAPTATQRFFVPFSHGHVPHSRVWSLVHPGSGGIDSAPVHGARLIDTLRACCKAAPDGTEEVPVAVRVATLAGVQGTHPFSVQLVRGNWPSVVQARCVFVVPTVTHGVGRSASGDVLNVASAAFKVLSGNNVLQHGSLVDVLCWNAERLVQAVLLAIGSADIPKGGVVVECVPPDPPTAQSAALDPDQSAEALSEYADRLEDRVKRAVYAHQAAMKDTYLAQMRTRRACLEAYAERMRAKERAVKEENEEEKEKEEEEKEKEGEEGEAPTAIANAYMEGVDLDNEALEDVQRLHFMLEASNIASPSSARAVSREEYEATTPALDEARKRAFLNAEATIPDYDFESALAYVCEHEVARVYEAIRPSFATQKGYDGEEERPVLYDDADAAAECPPPPSLEEFTELVQLRSARNHVLTMQNEYREKRALKETYTSVLAQRADALAAEAALMTARNRDTFYASVGLAGTILASVLGSKNVPRLRVAAPPGSSAPAWIEGLAEAPSDVSDLSLYEAALLLEQIVRVWS